MITTTNDNPEAIDPWDVPEYPWEIVLSDTDLD